MVTCPTCRQSFDPQHSRSMPFCCDRCKQIDLGRWLDERYSVPVERDPEEGELDGEGESPT